MDSLKFGTSGLRGLVTELLGQPSFDHTRAFLRHIEAQGPASANRTLLIGRDLRASSPAIAASCADAARACGWSVADCGALPTPALALEAFARACPAIMVTGSHIPDDRNGLKFYTATGEITKGDEAGILAAYAELEDAGLPDGNPGSPVPSPDTDGPSAIARYVSRYVDAVPHTGLRGFSVGVYAHSTVARDILPEIIEALGGRAIPFDRSDAFVPVDTEAHRPEDVARLAEWAAANAVDAIVSADGDGDRPLVADAQGRIVRGDVLGLLTALHVGAGTVVTPVTSASTIEQSVRPAEVMRTRVGSPFVIAAMEDAIRQGRRGVVGFEANGGVLLGTDVALGDHRLAALPTRDAVLPILCALLAIAAKGRPLAGLVDALGAGSAKADRLQQIPSAESAAWLKRLGDDASIAAAYFREVGSIASVDRLDGLRVTLADGRIIHYRASGNAPELRCYVEAAEERSAEALLEWGLQSARDVFAAPSGSR